ncbi:MAG: hypothetical protein ABUL53_10115 [Bradyrhizobium guangdongense]
MNAKNPLYDPKHWQKRAQATRAKAQALADQAVKQKLLRVAEEYERLAQRAEQWLATQRDTPSELWLIPETPKSPP